MSLQLPTWVKGRQGKLQELDTGRYKLTGPNLPDAVVGSRIGENLRWAGYLATADGSADLETTPAEFGNPLDALRAAFELYRGHFIS